MMGPSHRLLGGLAGVAWATAAGHPFTVVVVAGMAATATAHGQTSPDVDQTTAWRTLTRALPAGLRKHRGLTHWWGLPVLAWLLAGHADPTAQWVIHAMIVGWASHIVGDAVFGEVPLLPWGVPVGLDVADTGGFIETGKCRLLGKQRTVIPFGPVRLLMGGALAALLIAPWVDAVRPAIDRIGAAL